MKIPKNNLMVKLSKEVNKRDLFTIDYTKPEDPYYICMECGDIQKTPSLLYCNKCAKLSPGFPVEFIHEKFKYIYFRINNKALNVIIKQHLDNNFTWHKKKVIIWNRASKEQVTEYIISKLV